MNARQTISCRELFDRLCKGDPILKDLKVSDGRELEGKVLKGVWFENVEFDKTSFLNTRFENVSFQKCEFMACDFTSATFAFCTMLESRVVSCYFPGTDLSTCQFDSCWVHSCDFRKCRSIKSSEFVNCDLRYAYGLEFDGNLVRGTLLPKTVATLAGLHETWLTLSLKDKMRNALAILFETAFPRWLVLQKHYTLSAMLIYLVLTVVAILPHIAKAVIWRFVASAEAVYSSHVGTELPAPLGHSFPMWKVLLGLHQAHYWGAVLLIILLVFDFLRLYVTIQVLNLKTNQELTQTTPFKSEYLTLYSLHRVVTVLWFVAISSMVYHLLAFLCSSIWIPDRNPFS